MPEANSHHPEQILEQAWGYESKGGDLRIVDTFIRRLRKKLEEGRAHHPWRLTAVWGVGYKFEAG